MKHDPGKLYSFNTEGGIESTFTYTAERQGKGTRLTISLDDNIPASAQGKLPTELRGKKMRESEAPRMLETRQVILGP